MDVPARLASPLVQIDLDAVAANLRWLRTRLARGVELHAVVKADAYGHGAAEVARLIARHRLADRLVVATLDEAAALPLLTGPITVLRPVDVDLDAGNPALLDEAIHAGWQLTVESVAAVRALSERAVRARTRVAVQLMLDTGLRRCGIDGAQCARLAESLRGMPHLELRCLATHFATQDVLDHPFMHEQLARFREATDDAIIRSEFRITRSAAASGAAIACRAAQLDAVRIGAAMYGIDPFDIPDPAQRPLRPAMRWLAPLLAVREVAAGETVGYGQTWTATRPSRIGFVPVGYHDGYPRSASNRAHVTIDGHACPVVGRVSMDSIMVDLTDLPATASPGSCVVVLDVEPASAASVYSLARASGSIPYEIVARLGPRLPRRYIETETPDDHSPVAGSFLRRPARHDADPAYPSAPILKEPSPCNT